MQRKKLAANTISSLFLQLTTVICGFILPKAILQSIGSEANGLVNSILQFLQIIAFLELGVGAVVQSALYKPLAEKDKDTISRIIVSANRFFRRLAFILLGYTTVLMLFFPYITNQKVPHVSTALLIAAMSISSFSQYYFGIVNTLLLTADQRGYVQYTTRAITLILNTIASVVLLHFGASIQIVKLTTSVIYLTRPLVYRLYVNRHYTVNHKITYSDEPISQKWNGLAQHLAAVVTERIDVVVLTAFRPLKEVSVYAVYQLVATGVTQILMSMTRGLTSLIGNLWAKRELAKLREVFSWVEWSIHTGVILVFGIASNLMIPFISVYTRGISDADYHQPLLAGILILANTLYCMRLPYNIMILASGHYRQTQKYYFIAAGFNVVVSLAIVKRLGLNGVAIGYLSAMAYHIIWMSVYNAKNLLRWPLKNVAKQLSVDILTACIGVTLGSLFKLSSLSYLSWVIMAFKVTLLWIAVSIGINTMFYRKQMKRLSKVFKRLFMKFLHTSRKDGNV